MKSIMRKVFDCTLGALWRLYVKILFDNIIVFDHDLNFADWVVAIVITALFICAIYVACCALLFLAIIAIDFPLQFICCIIGIAVICILPRLALKSYRSSKAKAARASSRKAAKTTRASKKRIQPMMKVLENVLDFVLRCILPLPYCEVDGHKFWRKSSYKSWFETKEISRLRNEGKLHRINYRDGYEHEAQDIHDMLLEHLDRYNGKIYKVICKRFEPCHSSYDVMYLCDKKLELRCSVSEKFIVDNW